MSELLIEPLDLLLELEQRYRQRSAGSEAGQGGEVVAGRLAMRCGQWRLCLTMEQVAEIMPLPMYTRVPGVKAWLTGIANLRGRVVTVIDLGCFLNGQATPKTKNNRVVVSQSDDWLYGLLVDEIIGMRHFANDAEQPISADLDPIIKPYTTTNFHSDGHDWLAFDVEALLQNEQFLNASVS